MSQHVNGREICDAPDCYEEVVHIGLCDTHAEEEMGPMYPTEDDLL